MPVEIQLAKDAGKTGPDALAYVLRLPGYKERPLTADASDGPHVPRLAREGAAAPRRPSKHKSARPTSGRRASRRNPVDEDGLATPSF